MGAHARCKHQKRRTLCVECGGGSLCKHRKPRSDCVECGGGFLCKHRKPRSLCLECGGGAYSLLQASEAALGLRGVRRRRLDCKLAR